MPAIELLALLFLVGAAVMIYRSLIRSEWFTRLVGSMRPTPETPAEVLNDLTTAKRQARKRAQDADLSAVNCRAIAAQLKRELRRNSNKGENRE